MARIIIIGGIESTFTNAQVLHNLGENILHFYTRGPNSPGWDGVDLIDFKKYPFAAQVKITEVNTHINEYAQQIKELKPDFIYSLGWQQIYSQKLMEICPIIGLHESLLPEGAGAVPIANAILHEKSCTGVTLFWVDSGMDTGPIIAQLKGKLDPRTANSTQLYREAMALEQTLLEMMVPHINAGTAPAIPQDISKRTTYGKVDWARYSENIIKKVRVYPYA